MLIHIPANAKSATVVSFPRDSYVAIPGYGKGKINSVYALGYSSVNGGSVADRKGAAQEQIIATVSQFAGVHIDSFVEVTLPGVVQLTDQLGGIDAEKVRIGYRPASLPAMANPPECWTWFPDWI